MEADPKSSNPQDQQLVPPQMPYPTQQAPPSYAQVVTAPPYPQPYYPNQFAPVPQPTNQVYQPAQYVVTASTVPPVPGDGFQPRYSDYMCWSIVNMLFCCLPLGLVALIFSCKTQDAIARQDLFSARSHSSTARGFNIGAMVFGIFAYIFLGIMMFMIRSQQHYYYNGP